MVNADLGADAESDPSAARGAFHRPSRSASAWSQDGSNQATGSGNLRELLEQGFEVVVVKDATAAAQVPDGDGDAAAVTNFRFLASDVLTTAEAVEAMTPGVLRNTKN